MKKESEYKSLGEFLKEYRTAQAMTQKEMAEKIGINRSRYALIENNQARAGISTVKAIASITKKSTTFISALNIKKK